MGHLWALPSLRLGQHWQDCQAEVCLLSLLPHLQPDSGEPQIPEHKVILCASSPSGSMQFTREATGEEPASRLLNGMINAQVVTVA